VAKRKLPPFIQAKVDAAKAKKAGAKGKVSGRGKGGRFTKAK